MLALRSGKEKRKEAYLIFACSKAGNTRTKWCAACDRTDLTTNRVHIERPSWQQRKHTVNLPDHLQYQSQKPSIAFFYLTQPRESVIPKTITATRAMLRPGFSPWSPALNPPGSLMTATSQWALCALKSPWNNKEATAMFMSLQRLGAGCPLHAPNTNLVCGWVKKKKVKKKEMNQVSATAAHVHTHTQCVVWQYWSETFYFHNAITASLRVITWA